MLKDNWYFNRLKAMSVAEILFRINNAIKGRLEEKFGNFKKSKPELASSNSNILETVFEYQKKDSHIISVFGTGFKYDKPDEIDWQKDIISGESFSMSFYRKINIRENPRLSAKCVWEINRLQFLTDICLNYKSTKDKDELALFINLNKSWILQNPFLKGVNWYSNIEVNLRLITWFLCWEILEAEDLSMKDPTFKEFVEKDWLPTIRLHCIYSYENPSRYSSANNHLISEYAGLFIASSKWGFKESEKWLRYSQKGLEKEIIKQHSEEGINKEEAAEYIQFITDFFLLAFIVGEKTNRPFSERFKNQLYKIFHYIYNFLDCDGNFPKYGDEDDGKCFIVDYEEKHNNFKSLLTSGAVIFNDPVLKAKSNGFDTKNQLMFGEKGRNVFDLLGDLNNIEGSVFYKKEGHYIFRKRKNGEEIYLHFDTAPLGFLSIAAHGHADALSFVLHVDGQPVFIDSGTYTYHTEPEWRNYFIGTLAHNTVRINKKNQAVSGGPTLWIRHYNTFLTDLEMSEDRDRVKAYHDGYSNDNTKHIREITFDRLINEIQIVDTVELKKNIQTQVEIPFHLHPGLMIDNPDRNLYRISKTNSRMTEFYIDGKLEPVILKGQTEPQILGWYSESFLKKEPTNVIYCKTQIECTTTFKFIIKII
jgi:hypothetical protein